MEDAHVRHTHILRDRQRAAAVASTRVIYAHAALESSTQCILLRSRTRQALARVRREHLLRDRADRARQAQGKQ
ncbi:hypothetical protein KIPB_013441 [Kipferlia bialata]|uniref:Uncharacterized protein n=1 Tax=Kipferlia bialata TaxID=797122 RepID=A0A9K3DB48_9EUKA|nr:hypothetical protein KIPB_013441 [Kipferlia bialata]|eukprot:g13441.t1